MVSAAPLNIQELSFSDLTEEHDGIILMGCPDPRDWVIGVSKLLFDDDITTTDNPKLLWRRVGILMTPKGRKDLVLEFKRQRAFNMGQLSIWAYSFGDCLWISDYIEKQKDTHNPPKKKINNTVSV